MNGMDIINETDINSIPDDNDLCVAGRILEYDVVGLLGQRGMSLATAESCTGGLLAKRLTDVPGASRVFPGGVVAYSAQAKTALLGVDPCLINEKGVVSREIAIAMADGARNRFCADVGIGITGIAGPDSDGSGIAPGTVFVALTSNTHSFCRSLMISGDRDRVRGISVSHALDMARRYLLAL